MTMWRVQFIDVYVKRIAYVMAVNMTDAESKVKAAYPDASISSIESWPYDMVVI